MAKKGDRNMYEVYDDYNVINSHIFICICSSYSHSEASVYGHEILKIHSLPLQRQFIQENIPTKLKR